jgi:hypothetical protein
MADPHTKSASNCGSQAGGAGGFRNCQRGSTQYLSYGVSALYHDYCARLLMIIRNGSETALLTGKNTAGKRRVTAHDHADST